MHRFWHELILSFSIAFGVVAGGSFVGSLASLLLGNMPLESLVALAGRLKLWGIVAALGGTFFTIQTIETGLFEGQLNLVVKQLLFIAAAFLGAHAAYVLLTALAGRE